MIKRLVGTGVISLALVVATATTAGATDSTLLPLVACINADGTTTMTSGDLITINLGRTHDSREICPGAGRPTRRRRHGLG